MHDLVARASYQLLRLQAQGRGHGPVAPGHPVLPVQNGDEVGHRVEGALPFLFGPNQRRFKLFALGGYQKVNGDSAVVGVDPDVIPVPTSPPAARISFPGGSKSLAWRAGPL